VRLVKGHQVIRGLLVIVGVLLTLAGTVFALQGFGVLGGSMMSGNNFWAAAGPVIAVVGLVLLALAARRRPARLRP
jgi:signal peptidase I